MNNPTQPCSQGAAGPCRSSLIFSGTETFLLVLKQSHPEIKEVLVHGDGEVCLHHERVVAARGEKIDAVDGDGGVVHGLREGQVGHGGTAGVVLVEGHLIPEQGGILSANMITE